MFNNFGIYQPTLLLYIAVLLVISSLVVIGLGFILDPYEETERLAEQWKRYLVIGVVCAALVAGYGYLDHQNVRQFRDEGQTLRAQYAAQEKSDAHELETTNLALLVYEYNKHLDTLNQVFHFPGAQAVLDTISKI